MRRDVFPYTYFGKGRFSQKHITVVGQQLRALGLRGGFTAKTSPDRKIETGVFYNKPSTIFSSGTLSQPGGREVQLKDGGVVHNSLVGFVSGGQKSWIVTEALRFCNLPKNC